MKIILGSASKGRKEILENAGYEFEVMAADIDEKAIRFSDPQKLTLALANAKADALLPRIKKPVLLITSDQVVSWNGQIREKPESENQAREYLRTCAEYPSETVTAVSVTNTKTGERKGGVDLAKVYFNAIPREVIEKYIREGTPLAHAGGFTITDPIIRPYVQKVEGAEDSVIGLPMKLTKKLMREVS